jgi:TRAP-type C4-dicarboxylate transport system permease small subunit
VTGSPGAGRVSGLIDRGIAALSTLGEIVVAAMCLHIVAEIAANSLLGSPIEGTPEIVARWYMVAIVFLPFAFIQRQGLHIKAELFTDRLSPRLRALLDCTVDLLMTAMAALLAWYSFGDAIDATQRGERLELMSGAVITWPSRWLVPLGFATMGLVALLGAIRRGTDFLRLHAADAASP